jgi:hypothetical protein
MLLLERFIGALSPEEIEKVRALKLTTVERKVLDAIISTHIYAKVGVESTTQQLRDTLSMSQANLRFYSSHLLKKTYEAVVPGGGVPLLRFLAVRGLIHNFKNEIREQEKTVPKGKAKEFYFTAFELSANTIYSSLDLACCRYLGDKYLSCLDSASTENAVAVELRIRQAEFLRKFTMQRNPGRTASDFRLFLDGIPSRLNGTTNRYAQYAFTDAESYYKLLTNSASTDVPALINKMIEILPPEMEALLPETRDMLQYRLIQQYEQEDDPERIYSILEEFFSTPRKDLPVRHYMQHGYYAMLTKRFGRARQIFDAIAPKVLTKPPTTNTINFHLMNAAYYMLNSEMEKAKQALDEAANVNIGKGKHVIFEVYHRNLQLAYYAMMGDCDFCLRIVERNLDWLRKGQHDILGGWSSNFHYVVREMIIAFTLHRPPNPKVLERMNRYKRTGPDGIILLFYEELRNICEVKKKSRP